MQEKMGKYTYNSYKAIVLVNFMIYSKYRKLIALYLRRKNHFYLKNRNYYD